jgi:hypothetical protein
MNGPESTMPMPLLERGQSGRGRGTGRGTIRTYRMGRIGKIGQDIQTPSNDGCLIICNLTLIYTKFYVKENQSWVWKAKTWVTHQIKMTGPLAFVFAYLIGRPMKKNLPQEMQQ